MGRGHARGQDKREVSRLQSCLEKRAEQSQVDLLEGLLKRLRKVQRQVCARQN